MSDATTIVIGPVRLSYPYLFEPRPAKNEGGKKQYSCMGVIDPETATGKRDIARIKSAVAASAEEGEDKLKGTPLKKQRRPLKIGADEFEDNAYMEDKLFITCNSEQKPEVVDEDGDPIIDEKDIYPGCWVLLHLNFRAYNKGGGVGIGCYVNNVKKVADGKRLDNRVSAAKAFEGVKFSTDDIDEDDEPVVKKKKKQAYDEDDEPVVKKKKKRPVIEDEDEDDDNEPVVKKKKRPVIEDEDDDDEEDAPPAKKKRASKYE